MVSVQNTQLDRFHVKEHMQQAAHDIEAGHIIRSMQIENQTNALRDAITLPLIKARELFNEDAPETAEEPDDSLR